MKKLLFAVLLAIGVASSPAIAHAKEPAADTSLSSGEPNEAELREHEHYTNRSGERVHSPAHTLFGEVPAGATAQCKDGSYSFSKHRRGTCSGHGGVASWL